MKRSTVRCLALVATLQLATACTHDSISTGSAELDRLANADYGTWRPIIEDRRFLLKDGLRKINPYLAAASRESITTTPQRIVLSLLAIQKRNGVIVELGSWTGGGVLLMAPYLTHDQSYHAIDTFNADTMTDEFVQNFLKGRKHMDVFNENIAPLRRKVVVHRGRTLDVAATWPRQRAIDLLFIDADHAYEAVSADFKAWSRFVRKGGVIAFHDYYTNTKSNAHEGVRRFVDELAADPKNHVKLYSVEGMAWFVVK